MYELNVKLEDVETIKKLGAIYDEKFKRWYVPENVSPLFFTNWLNIYFLNVPFNEKDEAKKLGAKFDFNVKKWYISKDSNVNNFSKWLTISKQINIVEKKEEEKKESISLSELLNKVSFVVNNNFNKSIWVKCEIASLNKHSSGHIYLELIETDSSGREICKNRAIIIKNDTDYLLEKFKIGTDSELKEGIKALLLIKIDFSPKFGLGLRIIDIDPNYTLGGIEEKILKIRNSLIKQEIFNSNKKLKEPKEFTKVAVISPKEAAGLGDFKAESDWLEKFGLCNFDYYSATFQGNDVNKSIYEAFKNVEKHSLNNNFNYDVIVIIRGGGAKTDLHFLNEYDIAKAICESKVPVYTGIGHERDKVILDEVAFKSFDTPSKVVNYIVNTIFSNSKDALKNIESIKQESYKLVSQTKNNMNVLFENIIFLNKDLVKNKKILKDKYSNYIKDISYRYIQYNKEIISKESQNIFFNLKSLTNQENEIYLNNSKDIFNFIKELKKHKINEFNLLIKEIDKYNSKDILKMGFTYVKKDEKVIKSSSDLKLGDEISIHFTDGSIKVLIIGENNV